MNGGVCLDTQEGDDHVTACVLGQECNFILTVLSELIKPLMYEEGSQHIQNE